MSDPPRGAAMTIRKRFLSTLETNDDTRAAFVEDLRGAAELLDESGPDLGQHGEVIRAKVSRSLPGKLRDAAQRLCDHARTGSDDRCRYCEALMVGEER